MANFRRERLPGVIPDDAGGRNFYGLSAFRRNNSGSLVMLAAMRRASFLGRSTYGASSEFLKKAVSNMRSSLRRNHHPRAHLHPQRVGDPFQVRVERI